MALTRNYILLLLLLMGVVRDCYRPSLLRQTPEIQRWGFSSSCPAMPKLVLAAAIPLATFIDVFSFLFNAATSLISSTVGLHIVDEASSTLVAHVETAAADEILYGSSLSVQAVQASLPSVPYEILIKTPLDFGDADSRRSPATCAVCLSEINCEEEVRRLPHCRHLYHTPCIDSWLRCNRRTCPLCRASLLLTSQDAAASTSI